MPLADHRPTRRRARSALRAALLGAVGLAPAGCQALTSAREKTYNLARSALTDTYNDPRADEKFVEAEGMFRRGEYKEAQALFADIADNTSNAVLLAEKARYMEAECLRERKKLPAAAATYHRLLQDHPYGAYRERSCNQMYAIAYGWLETDTLAEIEAEHNGTAKPWYKKPPSWGSLFDPTRPAFDTEGEALRVLDNVQSHDGIGPNSDKALFWLGYVHYYRGHFDEADTYFSQLVELHKDSKLRPVALDLAIIAKTNATGGGEYDSAKASEALQLIHYAEASMPGYSSDPDKKEEMTRRKAEVRFILAQKYLRRAEYYERTKRPASAYFLYDQVVRQHAGTPSADIAAAKLVELEKVRQQMEAERQAPHEPNMLERVKYTIIGKPPEGVTPATRPAAPPAGGAAGEVVPAALQQPPGAPLR